MTEQNNELDYWEKQLIKYTKGHYKRTDYNKDLKYFPYNFFWIPLEEVKIYHIMGMVVRLHEKLVSMGYLTFKMERFIDDIFKRSRFERDDFKTVIREDIIRQLLAEIQGMQVKFNDEKHPDLDLGEVDDKLYKVIQDEIEKEEQFVSFKDLNINFEPETFEWCKQKQSK
jgi:hypothetical protein